MEKELTRHRDALNGERRRLPMVRVDKDCDVVAHDVKTFRFTSRGEGETPFQYLPGQTVPDFASHGGQRSDPSP